MKCRFEEFLVSYQDDLKRIVGKHLATYLHIKADDVVSTINYQLIKTKQKFFDRFGYDFKKSDFGRWAYNYARNLTKWQALRYLNKDEKLQDGSFYTEDGEKSLFDIVSEELGEENEALEEFDSIGKVKVIENIINKYSHTLSTAEKKVFQGLLEGKSEAQMAREQKVTRQAINITRHSVTTTIRAHYNFTIEDIQKIPPEEMEESVQIVLGLYNKAEKRRLRYDSRCKHPNKNLYEYVTS